MSTLTAASARTLTARLISREITSATSPNGAAFAAHAACERTIHAIIGWLGITGAELLMSRALLQARASHPSAADLKIRARPEVGFDGVAEGIQSHGSASMAQGLEAVLLAMVLLLIRLIGDTMTIQLLEPSVSNGLTPENERYETC